MVRDRCFGPAGCFIPGSRRGELILRIVYVRVRRNLDAPLSALNSIKGKGIFNSILLSAKCCVDGHVFAFALPLCS